MRKLWDVHVHLFPPPLFRAIWRWFDQAGWKIPFVGWELEKYAGYLQKMGVERAFLLTYAHKPNMSLALNRWVYEVCQQYPLFIPFACIHPLDNGLEQVMATVLDDWQFAGFKLQLAVQRLAADDPLLEPVYRAALARNKPVIIHAGTAPYPRPDPLLGLKRLERVLARWPELKVVVPHLGFDEFDQAMELVGKYPGVYLDTSSVLGNPAVVVDKSTLVQFIESYPTRILYGSDFPILEYESEAGVRALFELGLSERALELVLNENARSLLAR